MSVLQFYSMGNGYLLLTNQITVFITIITRLCWSIVIPVFNSLLSEIDGNFSTWSCGKRDTDN